MAPECHAVSGRATVGTPGVPLHVDPIPSPGAVNTCELGGELGWASKRPASKRIKGNRVIIRLGGLGVCLERGAVLLIPYRPFLDPGKLHG